MKSPLEVTFPSEYSRRVVIRLIGYLNPIQPFPGSLGLSTPPVLRFNNKSEKSSHGIWLLFRVFPPVDAVALDHTLS